MVAVNIREFLHHYSMYLKRVKAGERIVIMERNKPIADLTLHNENLSEPGWRRPIERIKIKGEPLSETIIKNRSEDRA